MLLKAFSDALKGDTNSCLVAADYLTDHHSPTPEKEKYVQWLKCNPTFTVFTEAIAKFGDKEERHLIRKVVKHAISLSNGHKKLFLSWMKHRISSPFTGVERRKFVEALKKFGIS